MEGRSLKKHKDKIEYLSSMTGLGNQDHSLVVFDRLREFVKEGLLCDITVRKGPSRQNIRAHRVVLLSAKSFDSDYNSESEATSESDSEDKSAPALSCMEDSVFEEAYAPDADCSNAREHMTAINDMRLQGECCDVTLETSDCEYKAHKCVLAAASDYFRAMFTSQMREHCMNCISLTEISEDEVHAKDILDFIYTGQMGLTDGNVWSILHLSTYYQISTLTEHCQHYLLARLNKSNCCENYYNANQLALTNVRSQSQNIIHDYFPELDGNTDAILIQKNDLETLLSSDTLGRKSAPSMRNESRVLRNVMQWLQHDGYRYAADVLRHIRSALIPKSDFMHYSRELSKYHNPGDTKLTELRRFIDDSLNYHERISEQPLLQTKNSGLREQKEVWICVDGVLAPSPVKLPGACHCAKSPTSEQQRDKLSQKIRDPFHSVVVLNGFVYAIGGTRQVSVGYSSSVIRYDSRLDTWTTVAPMNNARGDFYACAIDEHLYVFGGKNRSGALQSCEKYDPRTDTWEEINDLPDEGLYMMAGVVHKGVVYISGGFNDYDALGKTLKYTPDTNTWDVLPAFLFKDRGYHVMLDDQQGYIWAIGGIDNPFSGRNVWEVERFNVEYEMWEYYGQVLAVQPFLSIQRLNVFMDSDGNVCVFAVTNIDQSPTLRYNISSNVWERLNSPIDYLEIEYNTPE